MTQTIQRTGAVPKIKQVFVEANKPLSLTDIRFALPELKSSQISSLLCYLMRQNKVTREKIDNPLQKRRKSVWQYTYQDTTKQEVSNGN